MSRLITITAIICLLWPFYKNYLPSFFRTTSISNTMSSVLYPWEDVVYNEFKELEKPRFWGKIIEVSYALLANTFKKSTEGGDKVVIYAYEPKCTQCRFVLKEINSLAKELKDVKFMVVAFTDVKKDLSSLFNNFEELHFVPIMTEESNFTRFKLLLNSDKVRIDKIPAIVYVDSSSKIEIEIPVGLFVKNNILRLVEQ